MARRLSSKVRGAMGADVRVPVEAATHLRIDHNTALHGELFLAFAIGGAGAAPRRDLVVRDNLSVSPAGGITP